MAKANYEKVSLRGTLVWPRLTVPDTKFKAAGEYYTKVRVDAESPAAKALKKVIDKAAAKALEGAREAAKTPAEAKKWQTKNIPYKMVEDDQGQETGEIEFKFSMLASGVSKKTGKPWTRRPDLFDAKRNEVSDKVRKNLNVWSGSIGIVSGELVPYAITVQSGASVSLRLTAVQLIKVVSGGRDASSYGFEEEDGFSIDDVKESSSNDETASDDDGDDQGDADGGEDF